MLVSQEYELLMDSYHALAHVSFQNIVQVWIRLLGLSGCSEIWVNLQKRQIHLHTDSY